MTNITPEDIFELGSTEIFVFGSNLAGIHGAGAAKTAQNLFGARRGVGEGLTGRSYALPTKEANVRDVRPLEAIQESVVAFFEVARTNPDLNFLVTRIGCGFAGYEPEDIAPLFRNPPVNVSLPADFWELL